MPVLLKMVVVRSKTLELVLLLVNACIIMLVSPRRCLQGVIFDKMCALVQRQNTHACMSTSTYSHMDAQTHTDTYTHTHTHVRAYICTDFGCEFCPGGDLCEQLQKRVALCLEDTRFYVAEVVQVSFPYFGVSLFDLDIDSYSLFCQTCCCSDRVLRFSCVL